MYFFFFFFFFFFFYIKFKKFKTLVNDKPNKSFSTLTETDELNKISFTTK